MNRWLLPVGSLTTIVIAVVVALALGGVFDGDDASGDKPKGEGDENTDTAALCVEGAEDCDDTIEGGDGDSDDAAGTCLEGEPDCNDTPDISQLCAEGVADCDDTVDEPGTPPDDPVTNDNPLIPADNDCAADIDACQERAIEIALADLDGRLSVDSQEIDVESAAYQEWSNGCLDASGPGELCTQVITPGFVIVFQVDGQGYEYHTDLTANNVRLAE